MLNLLFPQFDKLSILLTYKHIYYKDSKSWIDTIRAVYNLPLVFGIKFYCICYLFQKYYNYQSKQQNNNE